MVSIFNLNENLAASILLTFGCLLFTSLLAIIYFCKKKQTDLRSRLYRAILISVIVVLVTDIMYLLSLAYVKVSIVSSALCFVHWLSFIVWVGLFCIYCPVYMQKLNFDSFGELVKKDTSTKIMLTATILCLLEYVVFPKGNVTADNLLCISGVTDYIALVIMAIMCTYSWLAVFTIYRKYPTRRKVAISLIMVVMYAMLTLQILFNSFFVYAICCSLQAFFLYFIIENPDIHLAREIESLKADIDKSNRSKTDFLSNMSHEIRTPMNAIIGFSDSLLNSATFDEATARNDIQSITTAGTNLVDIINNILDISKIESGSDTLDNKECSIPKIVKELGSIIESRIGNNPVKLYIELDEQIPSKVYGDATKIYQILLNITNNAVKYTEVGKIKLSVVAEKNEVDKVLLHFKISDTGYGIKKEDFGKIFEKFTRLDSAVSNEIEGTGLGLVITKKFVDLMGGKIWFTSEFEVGTTFYVDLPLKVIDPTPIGKAAQDTSSQRVKDFLDCSDFTALVVDDSRLNLKVAERLLKKYNFNVDTAESGKDCIYKFKYGNHYDIIFLDHMMPEMDGLETARILRRLDDYEIPPIIALTANAMNGMEEKYLSEGFDYYLPLPINTQELDRVIHRFFEDKTFRAIGEDGGKAPVRKTVAPLVKDEAKLEEKVVKHEVIEEALAKEKAAEAEVKEEAKVEEKPVEPEVKEEVKVEEKPVEAEVKDEAKVEDKPAEPEIKEEPKVEEKPAEPEVKEEAKVEEKPVEVEVKEEPKVEEKPVEAEVKEEPKVEERPVEPEVKEEVKAEDKPVVPEVKEEAKVEEKPTEPEVKEDVKVEEKPAEPEVKEEAKVEEKTAVPEVKEEPKVEEKPAEADNSDDDAPVEIATDKSTAAMEKYLRDRDVDMDKSLELLGDIDMYNMTLVDFYTDVVSKWDRITQYKAAKDMPNYAIEVHSLKSDCKYLGFMKLADLSYQHELKSKENDSAFVDENFEALFAEYKKVLKLVKDYLTRYELN